jgi:hypothetical protein
VTTRAHLIQPLYNVDRNQVLTWASIRIYEADGTTPYKGKIYRGISTTLTFPNPFVLAPALVDVWLDAPARVVLGYTPDLTKIETLTPVIDVRQDADELVTTANSPLKVTGSMVANGLLRAVSTTTAGWTQPGLSPHDHHGIAPGSTRLGPMEATASKISGFPGTTSIGVGFPPAPDYFYTWNQLSRRTTSWNDLNGQLWSFWSGQTADQGTVNPSGATSIGHTSYAQAFGAVSGGSQTFADPGPLSPYAIGAIAVGYRARAASGSIVLGQLAATPIATAQSAGSPQQLTSIGKSAQGLGPRSVSLGAFSSATTDGLAIGFNALGGTDQAVVLGAHGTFGMDAASMGFGNRDMLMPGTLHVQGDAHLGVRTGKLGFFDAEPVKQPLVNEGSGIPALDSLIVALRQLGLLASRSRAHVAFDAETLLKSLVNGDHVAQWPDDASDRQLTGTGITLVESSPAFNGRPSVALLRSAGLRADGSAEPTTSWFVVASHGQQGMAGGESLLTVVPDDPTEPRGNVFSAASGQRAPGTVWAPTMSTYERDGLDQTANKSAVLDNQPHVYRATLPGAWPSGTLAVGKVDGRVAPGWMGQVAEVLGVDDTWTGADLTSMSTGLAFKYHVGQEDSRLLDPATALLVQGQDPANQIHVNLDSVFAYQTPATVSGTITIPSTTTLPTLPTVAVATECSPKGYQGRCRGLYRLLSQALHWIEVYVLPTATTALSGQYLLGRFPIDANGIWSTGTKEVGVGYKVARPVLRSNNSPVTYIGQKLTLGVDAQIRISTVNASGTKTVETTVPLRSDGSWFGTVRHQGSILAELVKVTDGTLLADSSRPIPPTTLGQDSASVADLALAALAFLSLPPRYHFRAQEILKRLRAIQASDGSLKAFVSASSPLTTSGAALTSSTVLTGIAAARYKQVTRDAQFADVATKAATLVQSRALTIGAPVMQPGSTTCLTTDTVLAFWLWQLTGLLPQANAAAEVLAGVLWSPALLRFNDSVSVDSTAGTLTVDATHNLWTDLWTAFYCDAVDDPRAPMVRSALESFKVAP